MPKTIVIVLAALALASCKRESHPEPASESEEKTVAEPSVEDRARALAQSLVIVDGHVDLPWRLIQAVDAGETPDDPSARTERGDFDFVRAKEGGLDSPFMSIYVPAEFQEKGGARGKADQIIDLVQKLATDHPEKFAIARSPAEVIAAKEAGKIAFPLGIENGAALEDDIANVKHFYERGVRYVTLTHSKDNLICDSSYDDAHTHGGLSDYGKKVVAEMNDVGIMIDISHLSDQATEQVLELTQSPVIASHSSARHFTPGWERNMPDPLIKRLAEKGGVMMINFGSSFLDGDVLDRNRTERDERAKFMESNDIDDTDDERVKAWVDEYRKTHPRKFATVATVADHIDHVKNLVGIDHVGLGSDFDGVGDSLPEGLKDVSAYPNLIAELLRRGYSDSDLEKIASGNVFRVWNEVARIAAAE